MSHNTLGFQDHEHAHWSRSIRLRHRSRLNCTTIWRVTALRNRTRRDLWPGTAFLVMAMRCTSRVQHRAVRRFNSLDTETCMHVRAPAAAAARWPSEPGLMRDEVNDDVGAPGGGPRLADVNRRTSRYQAAERQRPDGCPRSAPVDSDRTSQHMLVSVTRDLSPTHGIIYARVLVVTP